MAKEKGRKLLLKIGNAGTPTETFDTVCALRSKTLTINNEEIDVTTADCTTPGGKLWTEVLDGVSRISISGSGISKKDAAEARLATVAMASPPHTNLQIVVPNFGQFSGKFHLSSFELGGEQDGGVTFTLSAASTGSVTFADEV